MEIRVVSPGHDDAFVLGRLRVIGLSGHPVVVFEAVLVDETC